jgi:hypothetical protein
MGHFGMKVPWAFLVLAGLMVVLPDFLTSGGDGSHKFGSPFCHFIYFFVFYSFEEGIFIWLYDIFYPHRHSPCRTLFPADFFQPWSVAMKSHVSVVAWTIGVVVSKVPGLALLDK